MTETLIPGCLGRSCTPSSCVPQEGTKPHGQMRTVFTPNMPYGQKQLSRDCLLAKTGAVWGKWESFAHNQSITTHGFPAAVGRTHAEDNLPPPGRGPADCPASQQCFPQMCPSVQEQRGRSQRATQRTNLRMQNVQRPY